MNWQRFFIGTPTSSAENRGPLSLPTPPHGGAGCPEVGARLKGCRHPRRVRARQLLITASNIFL